MNNLEAVKALKAEVIAQCKPHRSKPPQVFLNTLEDCIQQVADEYGCFKGVQRLRGYVKKSLLTKPNWGCNEVIKVVNNGILAIYKI